MSTYPTTELDPKIKRVWRISDGIWISVVFAAVFLTLGIIWLADPLTRDVLGAVLAVSFVVYVVALIVAFVVLTPIRYICWRYEVSGDFMQIAHGIFWRKHYVVPFIRVQNTDTRQGPILRLFGLASVTVSTAAGNLEIPGLDEQTAETLRDKAAELARIAREDV